MPSKTPGGGGGFGRGSSGSGGGGGGKKPVKPKKPSMTREEAKGKHPAGKALPNKGKNADVIDIKTKAKIKNPKPVKPAKPAQKPLNLTTRGKTVATAATGVAAVGTVKGMKKAGEMNAARIRRNKSKSVPVPRDRRKQ